MTDERLGQFTTSGAATLVEIEAAEAALGASLPEGYRRFLLEHGGGEGWIGEHYLVLWRASELASFNSDYGFPEHAPSLVAFGSNGGGEAFAFDKRSEMQSIVMVPFIGMSEDDALHVAGSLDNLLDRMATDPESLF